LRFGPLDVSFNKSIELMIIDPLTKGMPLKNFKDHLVLEISLISFSYDFMLGK